MSNSGSIRFGSFSNTGSQNSVFQLFVERYGGADLAATASVSVASGSSGVFDIWTASLTEGADANEIIEIDGTVFGAVNLTDPISFIDLINAVNSGSFETYALVIVDPPEIGDSLTVSVGATNYTISIDSDLSGDQVCELITNEITSDPDYDLVQVVGSSTVVFYAKTRNVDKPEVNVSFPSTGDGLTLQLAQHGPSSSVMTATENTSSNTMILTAKTAGPTYAVSALTDRVSVSHTQTGSYGSSGTTAVAGIDYINIFPYTLTWNDQESGTKFVPIQTLAPWSDSKVLELSITNLTNIEPGDIMSASLLIQSNFFTQSAQPLQEYSTDFTINSYGNLSSGFNRRTQQVPFFLNNKGTGKIKQP